MDEWVFVVIGSQNVFPRGRINWRVFERNPGSIHVGERAGRMGFSIQSVERPDCLNDVNVFLDHRGAGANREMMTGAWCWAVDLYRVS